MRPVALLAVLCVLAGCESTNIAPHAGPTATLDEDERRLWARAREEQARLDASHLRARLPEIESYLEEIIARLHPEPVPGGGRFRVRVLADPAFNAFAMPDGAIYVHTGLLAQAENEAQVATVLAHELVHAIHRHSVKGARQLRNQTALLATLGAGTVGAGVAGDVVQLLGAVGTVASVTGYSRDLERDADLAGFQRLTAAGYDPNETMKVFRALLAEAERAKIKAPFFFSTHPRLQERISSYEQLVAALPAERRSGRAEKERYDAAIPPVLALNADRALRAGDFHSTFENTRRYLALRPGDPQISFLLAEAHRRRGEKDDATIALRLLRELAAAQPNFADTHRSLGLMLMRDTPADAAASFRRYLELKPDASDRGYILDFIRQCETRS